MKAKMLTMLGVVLATTMTPRVARAQSGGAYSVNWSTAQPAGGACAAGSYTLKYTVAEPAAGTSSGGAYVLAGGFWPGAIIAVEPERPRLEITAAGASVILSWSSAAAGFRLQEATDLVRADWSFVATPPLVFGDENVVVVPAQRTPRFFRLMKP